MRRILNLAIFALILWAASEIFPQAVHVNGFWTLVLVAVLAWLLALILGAAGMLLMLVGAAGGGLLIILVGILTICLSETGALLLLSSWLDNFSLSGFWPAFLLALVYSILAKPATAKSEK